MLIECRTVGIALHHRMPTAHCGSRQEKRVTLAAPAVLHKAVRRVSCIGARETASAILTATASIAPFAVPAYNGYSLSVCGPVVELI